MEFIFRPELRRVQGCHASNVVHGGTRINGKNVAPSFIEGEQDVGNECRRYL
jgi:hypothetical protein